MIAEMLNPWQSNQWNSLSSMNAAINSFYHGFDRCLLPYPQWKISVLTLCACPYDLCALFNITSVYSKREYIIK